MVVNVKILISLLFAMKIKFVALHVSKYDFSAVGEFLAFH